MQRPPSDDNLTNIIQNLVIEKFTDTITYHELRRLQRKQRKALDSLSMEENHQQQETELNDEMGRKSLLLYHVMMQTSKAVRLCQSRKEFFGSVEHVEAEKILLFACVRREAILKELRKENPTETTSNPYRGTIKITKLTVKPKHTPQKNCWHLCLLKNGPKIFCTDAIQTTDNDDDTIEFDDVFIFEKLCAYFELEVCFYVFVAEKKKSKFFMGDNYVETPSFRNLGKTVIRIADLKKHCVTTTFGVVSFKIETRVVIEGKFKEFLSIGVEKRGVMNWNRRFCVLDGRELKYWNYPQEEEAEAPPIEVLNLEKCATALVNTAERCLCARRRTLLLEIYNDSGAIIKRFLSADNMEELRVWQQKINDIVLSLRTWGEIATRREGQLGAKYNWAHSTIFPPAN